MCDHTNYYVFCVSVHINNPTPIKIIIFLVEHQFYIIQEPCVCSLFFLMTSLMPFKYHDLSVKQMHPLICFSFTWFCDSALFSSYFAPKFVCPIFYVHYPTFHNNHATYLSHHSLNGSGKYLYLNSWRSSDYNSHRSSSGLYIFLFLFTSFSFMCSPMVLTTTSKQTVLTFFYFEMCFLVTLTCQILSQSFLLSHSQALMQSHLVMFCHLSLLYPSLASQLYSRA